MRGFAACVLVVLAAGCGGGGKTPDQQRYPFLVSLDEAWKIAKETHERFRDAVVKGDLEKLHKLFSLPTRKDSPIEALKEDYVKNKEEYVMRAKTSKLMKVFPPNTDQPFIDLRIEHYDGKGEFWRLTLEEKQWRIARSGRSVLELEYNDGEAPPGR